MTNDELVAVVGIVVSLAFSYFPGLESWFGGQTPNVKRLLQLAVAVVVSGAVFGLGCAGIVDGFVCTWAGALDAARLLVVFMIANQTAYAVSPRKVGIGRYDGKDVTVNNFVNYAIAEKDKANG